MLHDLGLSAYVVDVGVLGHAKPKMLGIYAPSVPLKELREAMETWSGELSPDPAGTSGDVSWSWRFCRSRPLTANPGPLRYAARTTLPVPIGRKRS